MINEKIHCIYQIEWIEVQVQALKLQNALRHATWQSVWPEPRHWKNLQLNLFMFNILFFKKNSFCTFVPEIENFDK